MKVNLGMYKEKRMEGKRMVDGGWAILLDGEIVLTHDTVEEGRDLLVKGYK